MTGSTGSRGRLLLFDSPFRCKDPVKGMLGLGRQGFKKIVIVCACVQLCYCFNIMLCFDMAKFRLKQKTQR